MKKQLGDLLVEAGIITNTTLERALQRQKGTGKRLGTVLEEMGVVTGDELVTAVAAQFAMKTVKNIASFSYPQELLDLVPEDMALQKLVFPLKLKDGMLAIAITDPFDTDTLEYLGKKTGCKTIPVLATPEDIMAAVKKFYLKGVEKSERTLILVVDDSKPVATIIQVALEKEGYDVVVGSDGVEGLKLAIHHKPTLIICDSVMPRMDGFAFIRSLRANADTVDIPVILLTSKASPEEEHAALKSGFLDFIAKPVMPMRVVSRVERAMHLLKQIKK
ncbi:response regulator [Geotalea sp. SG265]|uniref:response regulator n=1 Tax=Geotalea sp. SG265 TaxID=2922867 RepID=UPI001FAF3789|nr:response regulator [Geotalea sp. SG265]